MFETGNRKQETGNRKQETGNRKITSDAFSALAISALLDVGAKPDAAIRIIRSIHPVASSYAVSSNTDQIRAPNKGPPLFADPGNASGLKRFHETTNGDEQMKHKITLISVLLIACLASSSGICDWEAHLAWVNEFNEPGRCPCDGCDDVPYMDNYANYLDAKLDDYGYDWTGVSANMGAELREWADSEYVGDGQDHVYHVGVDAADLGFIITHGGLRYSADTDDVAIGSYVRMGAPDDGDSSNCRLDYGQGYTDDNALRDVRWGDSALNYMILNSCNSLDWFAFGYTNAYEHGDMRSPDLALINGYHGVAQAGSTEYSHFQGFVDNVQYNGIGEEWVDRMTIYRSGDDMCGVSVVYADNSADSEHIYQYGGFKDLQTSYIGTSANAYYWYMTNCNPAGRGPTPSI